jgi:murein DD-endopeptidase MepM/ murein hydrolase activator NlpD
MSGLIATLQKHKNEFALVTPFNFDTDPYHIFDFTEKNFELSSIDLNDEVSFTNYINKALDKHESNVGVGGYGENRVLYKRSEVFGGAENRSIHLGIDIWSEAGTEVFVPLDAVVHSFKNNDQHGDYGPTIILEHILDSVKFYTLYGHLNSESIQNIEIGQKFKKGQKLALFGAYHVNVHWPPHLHFQVISDIGDFVGDFPGVAKPSEKDLWLTRCPDPNLILNINGL